MRRIIIDEIQEMTSGKKPMMQENLDEIRIVLDPEIIQLCNMQIDENAFEAWLFAIKASTEKMDLNKNITLSVKKRFFYQDYRKEGHLCRFLYRAMKFQEQYTWCKIDEYLLGELEKFRSFLSSGDFTNNIGSGEASESSKGYRENKVERMLTREGNLKNILEGVLGIDSNPVNCQLPVGLFKGSVATKNKVFTDKHSAVDLWTWHGENELDVVELKVLNAKIGIITEIFFYSNYLMDLVCREGLFKLNNDKKYFKQKKGKNNRSLRGYEYLLRNSYEKINGIMLADDNNFHHFVSDDILKIMNMNNAVGIEYFKAQYPLREYLDMES